MIAIFDLNFDAILSTMYALSVSAEGDCYWCVPPDPDIAAAALGASDSGTLPGTVPAEALHTFTLDLGASRCFFRDSTTLTPLPAPVPVKLADPFEGPIVARSSTVLPCPALAASCSCRLLLHQTLLWHHRLGHPSLPRLRGMHSRLLHAAPHSSSFPPTTAPLQTLHMDSVSSSASGLARTFLSCACTLKEVVSSPPPSWGLLSWGGHSPVVPFADSPRQNGIAERRIGLVMEVARTSMIHAAAPHFLWPFAGSHAFVHDPSADKLSSRAIHCVFLGFVPNAHGWQFYHPTSRRVFPSQDVTFDESIPFYRLFPYRSAPSLPPPLFLAPGPPPVDPLPPQGPAPSGVS
ncbi:unnamed protein product [Closterium sp. NIES-54]